jgi:hypothetical protein
VRSEENKKAADPGGSTALWSEKSSDWFWRPKKNRPLRLPIERMNMQSGLFKLSYLFTMSVLRWKKRLEQECPAFVVIKFNWGELRG